MDNIQSANRPVSSPINFGVITSSPVPDGSPNVVNHHQNHLGVQNRYAGSSSFSNFGQESSEPSSLTTSITTTTSTTAATNQISRQSPLSPAESIITNSDNTRTHKVFRTEYKENFKPFDQYVYNEVTDTFVRSEQPNLISTPNSNIKSSTSNQDLAHTSMNDQSLTSLQNTHDATTFEPNQAQSNTEKTSNGASGNNVANEPWYKEVIKRNEKANEYRFKSELGHNSHILNYTTGSEIAHKAQGVDSESGKTNGADETTDNKQAVEVGSNQSIRQPVVYRYKRDNMIAQMAKNNNFKLPKEPADTVNSSTNRVKTPVNGSAAPSNLRSLTRSTAQSRARSQSSRRPVSTTPNGVQSSQTKKADSTNTTPTRTPTYVTSKATKPQSNLPGTPRPSPATVASSKLASNRRALNTSASSATATTPTSVNVRDTTKRVATAKPSTLNSKSGIITKKLMTTHSTPNTLATSKANSAKTSIPVKPKTSATTSRNTPNSQTNARNLVAPKTATTNKQLNSTNRPTSISAPITKHSEIPTSVKSNGLLKKEMAPVVNETSQIIKPLDDIVSSTVIDDILDDKLKRNSATFGNSDKDSDNVVSSNAPNLTRDVTPEPEEQDQESSKLRENLIEKSDVPASRLSVHSPVFEGGLSSESKVQESVEPELSSPQLDQPDGREPISESKKSSISQGSQNDLHLPHDRSDIQSPSDVSSDRVAESNGLTKPGQHDELVLTPHQLADLSNEYLTNKAPSETSETSSDSSSDVQEHADLNDNLHDEIKHAEEENVEIIPYRAEDAEDVAVEDEITKTDNTLGSTPTLESVVEPELERNENIDLHDMPDIDEPIVDSKAEKVGGNLTADVSSDKQSLDDDDHEYNKSIEEISDKKSGDLHEDNNNSSVEQNLTGDVRPEELATSEPEDKLGPVDSNESTSSSSSDSSSVSDNDHDRSSLGGHSEPKERIEPSEPQHQEPQQEQIEGEIQSKSSNVSGLGTIAIHSDVSEVKIDDAKDEMDTSNELMNYSKEKFDTTDEMLDEIIDVDRPKVQELILSPMQLADLSNDELIQDTTNDDVEIATDAIEHSHKDQAIDLGAKDKQSPIDHAEILKENLVQEQENPQPDIEEVLKKHVEDVYFGQVESAVDPMVVDNDEEDESESKHLRQYMDEHLKNNMAELTSDNQRDIFDSDVEKPRDFDTTPIESEEQVQQILDEIDTLKMNISDYIASKEALNDTDQGIENQAPTSEAIDTTLVASDSQKLDLSEVTGSANTLGNNLMRSDSPIASALIQHDDSNVSGTKTSTDDAGSEKIDSEMDLLGGMSDEHNDYVKSAEHHFSSSEQNSDVHEDQPENSQTNVSSINSETQNRHEEPYSFLEFGPNPVDQVQQKVDDSDVLLDFSGNSSNSTDVSKIVHPDASPANTIDLMDPEKADISFSVEHPITGDLDIPKFEQSYQEKTAQNKDEGKQINSEEK